MESDKTFELITKMYAEMTSKMDKMYSEMQGMNERLGNVETDTNTLKSDLNILKSNVKKIGVKIDGDVTPKIEALFDDYKQNSEQLNRIEQEVSKHEEVILKRVK